MKAKTQIAQFVKAKRKLAGINQTELAQKANVGLRFVRDLEQGKASLRMDKVNDVLRLFNAELIATQKNID
jgi:y4mF family transcriptional regulator